MVWYLHPGDTRPHLEVGLTFYYSERKCQGARFFFYDFILLFMAISSLGVEVGDGETGVDVA